MFSTCPRLAPSILAASAMLIFNWHQAAAGERCCCVCGTAEGCEQVCRLVAVDKKITIACWGCETEDICLPGASKPVCEHCEVACGDDGDPCDHCSPLYRKWFMWADWAPLDHRWLPCGRPRIITKKKLMRKTVTKTVPSYKWVVEDLCPACEEDCETASVQDGVLIPPAPKMEDVRILTSKPSPAANAR